MHSVQYFDTIEVCKKIHQLYKLGLKSKQKAWGDGSGFTKVIPWIQDLVEHYSAESMLEIGAGRNSQLIPQSHYDYKKKTHSSICTAPEFLKLNSYEQYDPAVPGIDAWPNLQFDCTILIMVLDNIPDSDFAWWFNEIATRTKKFCFVCENLYPNLASVNDPKMQSLTNEEVDLHWQIAQVFKHRTSGFYKDVLKQNWQGPDLYFLDSPRFPPTQNWMAASLLK
jgi:hypothetical protein